MHRWLFSLAMAVAMLSPFAANAKAHKLMQIAAKQEQPAMEEGKATLVLMRPSFYGGAIAATVYEVTNGEIKFIGVLGPKDKMAYAVTPGQHRFMVVAENADFMEATIEAGKTYYAVLRARPGMWKARFSLIPVQSESSDQYNVSHPEFKEWLAKGDWVESTPRATEWYEANRASVAEKYKLYLVKWDAMLAKDKAELTMGPEDGVVRP